MQNKILYHTVSLLSIVKNVRDVKTLEIMKYEFFTAYENKKSIQHAALIFGLAM
jgi:hypothetical protein